MIVVAAGCSHLFGSDLDDVQYPHASRSVWPNLIAEKLGAKCLNISKVATGNQGIFRRSIIAVHDLIENQKIKPADIILFVQFSHWDRHELLNENYQFIGADFPYVTTKFLDIPDPMIKNQDALISDLKNWSVAVDTNYRYLVNLQFVVLLNLWAEKLGVKMFYTFADAPTFEHLPNLAELADLKIGTSDWNDLHINVAKNSNFKLEQHHGIQCYKPKQTGFAFDLQSFVLSNMLNNYADLKLQFGQYDNWMEFCKNGNFSYKIKEWEQGDSHFRKSMQILKKRNSNQRLGNGHWGEDAHAAAAENIYQQLREKNIC